MKEQLNNSYSAVCKTAQATPGLQTILVCFNINIYEYFILKYQFLLLIVNLFLEVKSSMRELSSSHVRDILLVLASDDKFFPRCSSVSDPFHQLQVGEDVRDRLG